MKSVGTWSIDTIVKAWIDRKIANKSQFVNRILKDAMLDEIISQAKKEQRPKCPECKTSLTPNATIGNGGDWICRYIHCKAGMV